MGVLGIGLWLEDPAGLGETSKRQRARAAENTQGEWKQHAGLAGEQFALCWLEG